MAADRSAGDLGSRLRAARERRGVSLRQISGKTKISVSALEALERNDVSRLPGGIFSRAFVRSYASEVGLDPDEAIQDFLAQFPRDVAAVHHPPADAVEDHDAVESDRRTASTFLRLTMISIPLAAAVVYFGTAGRPPAPPVAQPPAGDVGSQTEAPATVATAPAAAPAPAEPVARASAPAAPAKQTAPTGGSVKPAVATPQAQAPAQAAPMEPGEEEGQRLTIDLTATGPCWVSATVDGEKKIERLLQTGERQTLDVARGLSLTAGDASAVKMTINGADARPLGRKNEVVTVRINPANFRSFLLSR
jgi:cytoskeletal protein RodZ